MKHLKFPHFPMALFFFALFGVFLMLPVITPAQGKKDEDKGEAVMIASSAGIGRVSAGDDEDDENGDQAKGTIVRGRVVYADTGRPVRRAEISLTQIKNGYNDTFTKKVITNSNGEFEITGVKTGTYLPYIKIPGVLNENSFHMITRQTVNAGKEEAPPLPGQIVVAGAEEVNVFIQAKRGGAISGKVLYFDGEPAVGMKVEVLKKGDFGYGKGLPQNNESKVLNISIAYTDDRGAYRFSGLPEGTYLIRVVETASHTSRPSTAYTYSSFPASSELKTYYPNVPGAKDAKPIDLTLGQEQSEIDLMIPEQKFFSIKGTVVAKADKTPLKNFTISFTRVDENAGVVQDYSQPSSENTNIRGEWDFVDLPQGKYLIHVTPPYDYVSTQATDANSTAKPAKEEPKYAEVTKTITFEENDIKDFVIEMPVQAIIFGTVVMDNGKPLPEQVSVVAFNTVKGVFSASDFIRTKKDVPDSVPAAKGDFKLKGLSEGTFLLMSMSHDTYIKEIRVKGATARDQKVEVKEGEQITGVEIILSGEVGTLKGKVNNFNKDFRTTVVTFPVEKSLNESFGAVREGVVKADGTFEFKVPPGDVSVIVVSEKTKFDPKKESRDEFIKRVSKNPATTTIRANETSEITVDLADQ